MEQQAKLVGQEAVAAQAVGLEIQLQFLDAIFHVAPEHIEVVINELGITAQVRDHEPLIYTQLGVFHLGDEAAGPGPGLRLIAEGGEEALLFSCSLVGSLGFFQERRGLLQYSVVGDEADDVADFLPL